MRTATRIGAACVLIAGLAGAAWAGDGPVDPLPAPAKAAEAVGPFAPTVESLRQYKCPEWFRDAKFGIWSCWNAYTVPGEGDWYARGMYEEGSEYYLYHLKTYGHPSKFGYKDILKLWKGENFNADEQIALFKRTGAKYFIVMANHHDNFDLWDSTYQPRWNSVAVGPRKNIVKLWREATLKAGLRFGVTTHLERTWSWFQVNKGADKAGPFKGVPYDGNDPAYADLYLPKDPHNDSGNAHPANAPPAWRNHWLARMNDLVGRYHPDMMYVDGGVPFYGDDQGATGLKMIAYLYNHSAERHRGANEAVMCVKDWHNNGRWGYYWEGIATLDLERTRLNQIKAEPWQTDTSIGDWTWNKHIRYRTAREIIHELVDVVSKNGNLLLNVSPRADGTLDADAIALLNAIGDWMAINGEAIYGTRPWTVYGEDAVKPRRPERDIRFTTKGTTLYAIALGWPADGKVLIRSLASPAGKIESVKLLGDDAPIAWSQNDEGLAVALPAKKPCDCAYVLKIASAGLKPAPLPPPRPMGATADGQFILRAADAEIHGKSPVYERDGAKDQIGFWANPADYVSWNIKIDRPGAYEVVVTYSCQPGAEGSSYAVAVGDQKATGVSKPTQSWATYRSDSLGTVRLTQSNACVLSVKPVTATPWKVIGLQSVVLRPVR